MKLNIVPATSGLQWISQSLATFKSNPKRFMGLAALSFLFIFSLAATIPVLGFFLAIMSSVYFGLAFFITTEEVKAGRPVLFIQVIQRIMKMSNGKKPMFILSFMYMATFVILLLAGHYIVALLFPQEMQQAQALTQRLLDATAAGATSITLNEVEAPTTIWYTGAIGVILLASYVITQGLFLFTAAIVYWEQASTTKALFFNLIAVYKNLLTLIIFAVLWVVIITMGSFFLSLLAGLLALLMGGSLVAVMAFIFTGLAFFLFLMSVFQISVYYAFKSCLIMDVPSAPTTAAQPN